jgi:Flp pilus assembly protein TadG
MSDASLFNRVLRRAANFRSAKGGNVAVIFSFALVPLLLFVGVAIDYTRANTARTAMQEALDSAALMLSKDANGLTESELQTKGLAYFQALYTDKSAQNIQVNVTYTESTGAGSQLTMTGSGSSPTDFLYMAGYQKLDFGASSTTVWGTTKLRVALVLDNTGSMASAGKMTALKSAAKSLLTQLQQAASKDGDVYVSIVPFAKDVNVGSSNKSATWLRWDLGQCTSKRGSALGFMSQSDCNKTSGSSFSKTSSSGWKGCVSDRDMNYDTMSTEPYTGQATAPDAANLATQFPAETYSDCPVQLVPQSYNWSSLASMIDTMQPTGNTNQAIGLAWGWLSLLQQSPLSAPAEDSNYKYSRVIILLSDGDNTQNRYSSTVSAIDARQKLLCDNIKAVIDPKTSKPMYTIYTIQVNTANDNTSPVMSYCASSTDTYFSTTTAAGINNAFSAIGASLSKLRVAQ